MKISPKFIPNSILFHSPISKEKPPFTIPPIDASEAYLASHIKSVLGSFPKLDNSKLQNIICDLQEIVESKFEESTLLQDTLKNASQVNSKDIQRNLKLLNQQLELHSLPQFLDWFLSLDEIQKESMRNFKKIIRSYIIKHLRQIDTWKSDILVIKNIYDSGIQLLNELDKGIATENNQLQLRMKEILFIREELFQIDSFWRLHHEEPLVLYEKTAQHFDSVDSLHYSKYTEKFWNETLETIKQDMKRVEISILPDIQSKLSSYSNSMEKLIEEFMRNKLLILSLKEELIQERKLLLQQMNSFLTSKRLKFEEFIFEQKQNIQKLDLSDSQILNIHYTGVVYSIQLKKKILYIIENIEPFINNTESLAIQFITIKEKAKELELILNEYQSTSIDSWQKTVNLLIKSQDPKSSLLHFENLEVIQLNDNLNKLTCSFNPLISTFIEQYQSIEKIIESPLQKNIQNHADDSAEYISHSFLVNQSIHFYNRTQLQILPSQKKMMQSIQFEIQEKVYSYLKQSKGIWNRKTSLKFQLQIKEVIERYASENRKYRKYHTLIGGHIVELMSINLLIDREKWVEKVTEIRKLFQKLEHQLGNGTSQQSNLLDWKYHWEHQLFKAFEYQYQLGLQTLNEYSLSEMSVELIFKEKRVQFLPSLEKIRELYFRKLRDFIAFPLKFQGIGAFPQIYGEMIGRNNDSLQIVYKKSHQLFQKLDKVLKGFQSLVILGTVSNWENIGQFLQTTEDFYLNFVKIKEKRAQIEKIENTIKRDCVTISTKEIKQTIEDQLQRLEEFIVETLRIKANNHLKSIDRFIDESLIVLNSDPQSMEEINLHFMNCKKIIEEKKIAFEEFQHFDAKSSMLKKIVGIGLSSSKTRDRWNEFMETLRAQSKSLSERRLNLKDDISTRSTHFQNEIMKYRKKWAELFSKQVKLENFSNPKFAEEEIHTLKERREEIEDLKQRSQELLKEIAFFDSDFSSFPEMDQLIIIFNEYTEKWKPFESFLQNLEELKKQEWIIFKRKLDLFEDFITSQREIMFATTNRTSIQSYIIQKLEIFEELLVPLKYLHGDGWTLEHWIQLFHHLNIHPRDLTEDEQEKSYNLEKLRFGHFIDHAVEAIQHFDDIKILNSRAMGEDIIRKSLQELKVWESTAEFTLFENVINQTKTPLIREWKDILTQVGEHQSLLSSLRDHQFAYLFTDEISGWDIKLSNLENYLKKLNDIQRRWLYLAPIFFKGSLPSEQSRFLRLDTSFRSIMQDILADPRLLQFARRNLNEILDNIIEQLSICQQALNEFLESKREKFPRFYFLGDDDLLEILGQATNPSIIQSHLKKLFAGIHSVNFSPNNETITSVLSIYGENVNLSKEVRISDKVEEWLLDLDNEVKNTLSNLIKKSLQDENNILNQLLNYPSQILNLTQMINFTLSCEKSIQSNSLYNFLQTLKNTLKSFTKFDPRSLTSNHVEINVLELKIKSLILDIIHNISVVEELTEAKTNDIHSWSWQKQLRYYVLENNQYVVRMCDAQFDYTFEYQGNVQKLVHTPLTDKCYLTLTQGMHLGYGGNPYGPAGTGKTESVKALGSALGRFVIVQNCDEGIDFKSMGRIFFGLVKCGAWGCFDEFNRLKEDQLSAVSQQIQVIQHALKTEHQTGNLQVVELNGKSTEVDPNSGIFVTLNPAGKHYGGRSKLPDNLKQLFRSVSMSKPDDDLIAEVIMFSEGFEHAKTLSKKLVTIFQLCKQLLSPQQHYDWGLRALKTILKVGGDLVKQHKNSNTTRLDLLREESEIIIKALSVNTISKLTSDDASVFEGILSDIFPNIVAPSINYSDLEKAIKDVLTEKHLQIIPTQIQKILQFYEAIKQRMGVVVVGPSGSGKSTCWQVCLEALKKIGQDVKSYICNPKSISRQQLLGYMDIDTREWNDGILTANSRKIIQEPLSTRSWIVCDGDIDPKWIEALNSVLDDNRLLSMPTGERIQFADNVNFVFETHSLKFASPATVSRMGMIFFSEDDIPIQSIVEKWLSSFEIIKSKEILKNLLFKYLIESINILVKEYSSNFNVSTTKIGLVFSTLGPRLASISSKGEFVQCIIQTLGGYLNLEDRVQFAKQIFQLCEERPVDIRKPLDCYYSITESKFVPYTPKSNQTLKFDDLLNSPMIPTIDIQRSQNILMTWLLDKEPFILIGPEGSGKSTILNNCFKQLKNTQIESIYCNSQTQASNIIQKLLQSCSIYTSGNSKMLRPKDSENLILYLRDINLPKPDEYDTSQVVSFLQQILTYNCFYDDVLDLVQLERIQIIASMNPSSTVGRYSLSQRLTSIVRIYSISYPKTEELVTIYSEFTKAVIEKIYGAHPIWSSQTNINLLSNAMVSFYSQVVKTFSIDDYSHYVFTPRDLTQWIIGLNSYDISGENDPSEFLDIWVYEGRRIFKDKILQDKEYETIESNIIKLFSEFNYECKLDEKNIVYSSLIQQAFSTDSKKARLLKKTDMKQLAIKAREGMKHYERENRKLRILLIPETVEYIARVDRVISRDGGNLLLVGQPGVGRTNIVSLLCHLHRIELFTPKIVMNYSLKHFKQDFKSIFNTACLEDKAACFLLEDHQNFESSFFEHLNSLLISGEFPNLHSKEELDSLLIQLKEKAILSDFKGNIYDFMAYRAKKNIRIILCMNPNNSLFTVQCQSNPSILNCCSIQWKTTFTSSGYVKLPKLILKEILSNYMTNSNVKQNDIILKMVKIHLSLSENNSSPIYFIRFLDTFKSLYEKKLTDMKEIQERYTNGLKKLLEAEQEVDRLSKNAQNTKQLLAEKKSQTTIALSEIDINMKESAQESSDIEKLRSKISEEESKIREKDSIIQDQLKNIQPLIDSAKEAVGSLSTRSLGYIRSLPMPPNSIRDVLSGVLRLMGNNDTSWKGMKKFLGERGVVNDILNLDPRTIPASVLESVKEHINEKADSFNEINIQRVNAEAAVLAKWVVATVTYAEVLKKVEPLEKEAKILKSSGQLFKNQLTQCESKLVKLQEKVITLQNELQLKTKEVASLGNQLEKAEATLTSAQSLLIKLSDEKERWIIQNKEVTEKLKDLPSLCVISSAFITYLPAYPEDFRTQKLKIWKQLLGLNSFDFCSFMIPESQLLKYKSEGLPSDQLSQENAIVILESVQYSLIIDPAQQATKWLKQHVSNKNVDIINASSPKFASQLELAIRFGKILIIEEVDHVEPILFSILRKEHIIQGPRKSILLGDKVIDFNDEFQLYLVTRNSNIQLPPDVSPLLTLVNFSVTRSGLEGQLLGITINHENPGLEQQKQEELRKEEEQKIQLAELESELLKSLSTSNNLLQDTTLIANLDTIKINSIEIKKNLEISRKVRENIETSRNLYSPFAKDGSSLFFLIQDLSKINRMYQFSLTSFLKLFQETLQKAPKSDNFNIRIESLKELLINLMYNYYCRSLFKCDQLLFAMHLCKGLYPNLIEENLWNFFIGNLVPMSNGVQSIQAPKWLASHRTSAYEKLSISLPSFVHKLNLQSNSDWNKWIQSTDMASHIPKSIVESTNDFERILLTQVFNPSQLTTVMIQFVQKQLKITSIAPPPHSLIDIYETSSNLEPILLIATPGSDPSLDLEIMANQHLKVGPEKFHQLAMGQGQTETAILLLRKCAKNGEWLCLKNLHLVNSWLGSLEMELSLLDNVHPNFRLWLTTDIHEKFPIMLLRESLKYTFEAPPGIKQNLIRTLSSWNDEFIRMGEESRARLLFIVALFHAILQERRSYIPIGWTKFYEFSNADLRSAVDIIESILKKNSSQPDWESIHGVLEYSIYGGRIDDSFDLRNLRIYLKKFFNQSIFNQVNMEIVPKISIPSTNSKHEFLSFIYSKFTDIDSPELFGLPSNARSFVQMSLGEEIISKLKKLDYSNESGNINAFSKEQWNERLAPILQFWKSTTSSNYETLFSRNSQYHTNVSNRDPISIFISLEYSNSLSLIKYIDDIFTEIHDILKGTIVLSSTIQEIANDLIHGIVPQKWQDKWEGPENIQQYIQSVVRKTLSISKLVQLSSQQILQEIISLDDFFNPHVFLNALKQKTARTSNTPLDELNHLVSTWKIGTLQSFSSNVIKTKNLLLQGAQFNDILINTNESSESFTKLPECEIGWCTKEAFTKFQSQQPSMDAPLYFTSSRDKLLTHITLPCKDENTFSLFGTCTLVSL